MAGEASPKIDPTSPYYIGLHDRSSDLLTTVRLALDNFDDWAQAVRHALRSRRKFGFLDGTYTSPQPPCTTEDWETLQSLLVTWLNNTISVEVRSLLSKYEDAKTMWDDIHAQFNVSDGPRLYQIKASLYDCRQRDGMTVATYFGKLCQLWDELDKLEPIITSKLDPEVGKEHLSCRNKDRLHLFLFGLLPDPFSTTRSVILTQKPPPDVREAFQLIIQEERSHGMGQSASKSAAPSTDLAAFSVRSAPRSALRPSSSLTRTERRNLICTHCSRKGHDRSMCFELLDELRDWWYELKGLQKPSKGNASRPGGAATTTKGGRGGGRQHTDRAQTTAAPSLNSANAVLTTPAEGPSYEDGDWTG